MINQHDDDDDDERKTKSPTEIKIYINDAERSVFINMIIAHSHTTKCYIKVNTTDKHLLT